MYFFSPYSCSYLTHVQPESINLQNFINQTLSLYNPEVHREALPVFSVLKVTRRPGLLKDLSFSTRSQISKALGSAYHSSHCSSSALLSRNRLPRSLSHRQTRTCALLLSHINYAAKTPLHSIEIWASHPLADCEMCVQCSFSERASACRVSWKLLERKKSCFITMDWLVDKHACFWKRFIVFFLLVSAS